MKRVTDMGRLARALPVALVLGLVVGACTDEETVFVDRPPFDQPSDQVNRFLGYFQVDAQTPPEETKLTSCGNCHATFQAGWSTTGHYDAWAGLQANPGAQDFCEPCHTVSGLGSSTPPPGGHTTTQDTRYVDVQCESCHGSGWDHVNAPTTTQPLASIAVDTATTNGCDACHQDTHHPFVEEWLNSRHAVTSFASGREECAPCHEGRTALESKFYSTSDYTEKSDPEAIQPIVCVVCHSPHGSDFDANLRAPIDEGSLNHLCVRCHSRSGTPPSRRGPHAAQGLLLLNENVGWIPAGTDVPTANAHGFPTNQEMCVTCHVNMFEVDDAEGNFLINVVGHRFEAVPCLGADGVPTDGPCADSDRDFSACAECHGSEGAALQAFETNRAELDSLLDVLWVDSDSNAVMDATDAGLLAQVVAQGDTLELDPSDQLVTVAEGALWNAQLAYTSSRTVWSDFEVFGVEVSAHKASGDGVHNPSLLEALLDASIDAVRVRYGLAP